jgi:hypothetical protein
MTGISGAQQFDGRGTRTFVQLLFVLTPAAVVFQLVLMLYLQIEPYPALVMPAGAGVVRHGEPLTIERYELLARAKDTELRQLDQHELLADLPAQYRAKVLRHLFMLAGKPLNRKLAGVPEFLGARSSRQLGFILFEIVVRRSRFVQVSSEGAVEKQREDRRILGTSEAP